MLPDTSAFFSQTGTATTKLIVPADAVGETAEMAGLAARSTAARVVL